MENFIPFVFHKLWVLELACLIDGNRVLFVSLVV